MEFCRLQHGHTGACGRDPLEHLERVGHLRAALAEVDRLNAEARAAFDEAWDADDDSSAADLVRIVVEAYRAEHDRFRARGEEIDRLQNVLLVERGEGVPPPGGWEWDRATAWMLRLPQSRFASVENLGACWRITIGPPFTIHSQHPTAFEAMEAANTALGVR
jgi:hypothetical protein